MDIHRLQVQSDARLSEVQTAQVRQWDALDFRCATDHRPSQNSLTRALEGFQEYYLLSTEIFQREQVNMILYVSVPMANTFLVRMCKRIYCSPYRRLSNEQFY
jgi:hypothetical protein